MNWNSHLNALFQLSSMHKFRADLTYLNAGFISHQIKNTSHTDNWSTAC